MEDTICAISTSMGIGAISIVRVCGKDAINIVNKIFNKDISNEESHTIHYGYVMDNKEKIDEVLVMLMKSPKTYTLEDIVEINCHGGLNTTNKVMELLLQNGCRLAEAGEFTKRAFLNGRINLLEAEAVNDLIMAKTDATRIMAMNNIDGLLTKKIRILRERIVKLLANIEVNIDYPEYEDELVITNDLLKINLRDITEELTSLVNDSKNGRIIKEGINIAIVGKPNVGKSSILNFLLDEEKAIVTNIPGTTRDIVEGSISLNGVQLNFIDTAGIRETEDIVEKIGVDKSIKQANIADLVIFVLNNNEIITQEELELLNSLDKEKVIILINKSDLENVLDKSILSRKYIFGNTVDINGLDELKKAIIDKFNLDSIVNKDMSYLSNLRQIDLINKANGCLENANNSLKNDMPIDVIEIDIKECWNYLGEIIGDSYKDELVDNIFSNFCLGK